MACNRVVSEGFQKSLKPCGFRGVSEWHKTVGGFRGFKRKVIWMFGR